MAARSEELSSSSTTMEDLSQQLSTTMASLSEDLIEEILIRLPFKSLLRFKTVSKKWYYLISQDNDFANRHLKQSSSPSKNIFFDRDSSDKAILYHSSDFNTHNFDFPDEIPKPCRVFGSANGLICVAPLCGKGCFLWNPFIGDCKIISPTEYFSTCRLSGFCYDSNSDDYKIVGVWTSHYAVFSLKNHSWTKRDHNISFRSFTNAPIFSNGALHWCFRSKFVAFDSAKEQLFEMVIPTDQFARRFYVSSWTELLFDYQGYLCCFDGICYWMMKEYGVADSWVKLDSNHVTLSAWISRVIQNKTAVKLLGFLHTESLISPKHFGANLIKDQEN